MVFTDFSTFSFTVTDSRFANYSMLVFNQAKLICFQIRDSYAQSSLFNRISDIHKFRLKLLIREWHE
jgi:hypothetical protein